METKQTKEEKKQEKKQSSSMGMGAAMAGAAVMGGVTSTLAGEVMDALTEEEQIDETVASPVSNAEQHVEEPMEDAPEETISVEEVELPEEPQPITDVNEEVAWLGKEDVEENVLMVDSEPVVVSLDDGMRISEEDIVDITAQLVSPAMESNLNESLLAGMSDIDSDDLVDLDATDDLLAEGLIDTEDMMDDGLVDDLLMI